MSPNLTIVDHLDITTALLLGFATLYIGSGLHLPIPLVGAVALMKVTLYLSFVDKIRKRR